MSDTPAKVGFAELLRKVKTNEANHNRWKRLATYGTQNTAKMTASRLRARYEKEGFAFKVVPIGDGTAFAVGVLYKRVDPDDGRIPDA